MRERDSPAKRPWWRRARRYGCIRIRVHTNPGIFENAFFSFLQIGRFLHKLVNPPKKTCFLELYFPFFSNRQIWRLKPYISDCSITISQHGFVWTRPNKPEAKDKVRSFYAPLYAIASVLKLLQLNEKKRIIIRIWGHTWESKSGPLHLHSPL